jgi:hypothetical protein
LTILKGAKVRLLVAMAVIAMLPAIITWWLPHYCFKAELRDYVPATLCQRYNDATMYWLEINSFAKAGFHTGYFGREEDTARCSLVHFGWQNFIVYVYGPLAAMINWKPWSSVIWNPIMLSIALFSYLVFVRSQWKQTLMTGLFIITFWPVLFFLPTMMTESFHYCVAILAAAGYTCTLNSLSDGNRRAAWLTTIVLFIGTVARPSWAPLLLLAAILAMEQSSWKSYIVAGFVGFFICVLAYSLFLQMMPDTRTYSATGAMIGGHFSPSVLLFNIRENLKGLSYGEPSIILFRIQVALILVASFIGMIVIIVRNASDLRKLIQSNPDWIIHTFNLFSVIAITILLYTTSNWGDYRLISIHLLFSGLLAISRRSSLTIPIILIASNLLMTNVFIGEYRYYRGLEFGFDKTSLAKFADEVRPYIKYDPKSAPQDNTLLFGGASNSFPTELIALPAGIGLRVIIYPENIHFPIHSRYVLFDKYSYMWFPHKEWLKFLTSTRIGDLYYCMSNTKSALMNETALSAMSENPNMVNWTNIIYQKRYEVDLKLIQAIQNLAIAYSQKGEDTNALMYLHDVINMNPNNPDAYYNIACIYAKQKNMDESIIWLKQAIEKGFHDYVLIRKDPDLANIRNTTFVHELLQKH